jgi:hypothetical protein
VDVSFAQGYLFGEGECGAQRARVVNAPSEPAEVSGLGIQTSSIPELDCEIAPGILPQQLLNNRQRPGRSSVSSDDSLCVTCHPVDYALISPRL